MGNFEDIWNAHRAEQDRSRGGTPAEVWLKKHKYLDLGKAPTLKQIIDLEDRGYIVPKHLKEEARVRALAIAVRKKEEEDAAVK